MNPSIRKLGFLASVLFGAALLPASAVTNLAWDPATSQAGTQSVNQPNTLGGSYLYHVVVPAGAADGMRVRLRVTAADAAIYLKLGEAPTTSDYDYHSAADGNDLILLQADQYAEAQDWYILVEAEAGATWNLLAGTAAMSLGWDPGTGHAGTVVYPHPNNQAGSYWFKVTPETAASGAWRTALAVTAGDANLYLRRGSLPDPDNHDFAATRSGADGMVLRPDQFAPGETWYLLVDVPTSAIWRLVSGDAYVQDLGELRFTDADADGIFDPGETVLESGSGAVTVGPEGIRYFKATVAPGCPAWNLWLGGGSTWIHVRKNTVPFANPDNPTAFADKAQAGRMLLVPDYLQASSDVYYLGIPGDPGTSVNLRSQIHTFTDIPFNSTRVVSAGGTDAGYRTFRVQVPIDQIAWETSVTNTSGDGNVALRRDVVPNEFHNDAVSDTSGVATDSVTLAPPTLTNGTFFITLYGAASYQVSLFNGNPVVTELAPFNGGSVVNTTPDKVGWRYYVASQIDQQFGLGWELELSGAPAGTEIAIRRNAVPARWRYRDTEWSESWLNHAGHVDQGSTNGLLQQVDHASDVWYIGVYNPDQALGNFTLTSRLATAATVGFNNGTTAQSGHPAEVWRWFRIEVPAGPVGWDLRLRNVTAGLPRMAVRRNLLPGSLVSRTSHGSSWWPGDNPTWESGNQWAEGVDLTGRPLDPGDLDASFRHLTCGMGRPLEPGTYYVGVRNDATEPAAYTLESRGIGAGLAIPVTALGFAGDSKPTGTLGARDLAVFKVAVPAGTSHWSLRLTPTTGELMMALLKGTVPSDGGYFYQEPFSEWTAGVRVQKTGTESLSLFPPEGSTTLPAGDYYVVAMSEGDAPAGSTVGSGSAAGTLSSLGTPGSSLGTLTAGVAKTAAVVLAGGEAKVFTATVPAGTSALEIRLDNRVGNPHVAARLGSVGPAAFAWGYPDYGYYGGNSSGMLDHPTVVTFPNPPAGPCTITVRARETTGQPGLFDDATATLVVTAVVPTPIAFDGGASAVSGQNPDTWRFFRVDVTSGPVGWDLRLKDITGGAPRMVVRRDLLPDGFGTHGGNGTFQWWPGDQTTWPSGWQWAQAVDATRRGYDPGPVDASFRHLTCGMGRPLEPGIYYIGVRNDGTAPADYTLESRAIGSGRKIPVTAVAFAGGSAGTGDLAARDLAVFKVTVPAGTSHWSLRLTPTNGELMLAVLKGTVPSDGGYYYQEPYSDTTAGVRVQKHGAEFLSLFPPEGGTTLPPGDYYVTALAEGDSPPDSSTVGSGTAAGTFTSLGAPATSLGTPALGVPVTTAVSLSGGQTKVFTLTIPPGTASLEARLDDRTGNPHLAGCLGLSKPRPFSYWGDDYGYFGGASAVLDHPSVVTFASPPEGPCSITVRARRNDLDLSLFEDATANLVITALPPAPVAFNGGTSAVTDQTPATWRFFKIEVPSGPLGWDLRLRDVTSGLPRMVVRRGLLPDGLNSHFGTPTIGWYPGDNATWPVGAQWAEVTDLTNRTYAADDRDVSYGHLTCGMGRPLEPGTYYVGVRNDGTEPAAYTLESRGIGGGQLIPVTTVPFAGGAAATGELGARDVAVFKVAVPAGASHWSLRLEQTTGELMMAVLKGTLPGDGGQYYFEPFSTWTAGIRMQKDGDEYLSLFPPDGSPTLPAGDYYVVVLSEGNMPADRDHSGPGSAAGVLRSLGAPLTALGAVAMGAPVSAPVTLSGGQTKVFTVTLPPGVPSLQIRLDDRSGIPHLAARSGAAGPTAFASYVDYGHYGGNPGTYDHDTVVTLPSPPAGPCTITVRGRHNPANDMEFPDAAATLVVTVVPPTPLNFGSYANSGGGSNQDTRQLINGARVLYQVAVPSQINGQPVLGWKIDTTLAAGDVQLRVFQDLVDRTPYFETSLDTAIVVPPFFTPGNHWYVEVTAVGVTEYTLTSEPVTLLRPAWALPPDGQLSTTPGLVGSTTFGDSGIDQAGEALPGDQGTDLGQDDWHFYAIEVPAGNRGVLRTVLENLNGNPDLFLRHAAVPSTLHGPAPPNSYLCLDYSSTGTGTQYGNWVPLDARTAHELAPGTWYLGVNAVGGTNCRYRLKLSVGDIQPLALNGGSLTGQNLIGGDWRYYALTIPETAPRQLQVTFATQQGGLQVHWRSLLLPGDAPDPYDFLNASHDALNQGPYPAEGWTAPGSYLIATPPLRPNSKVWLGVKATSDAVFSIATQVVGGSLPIPPELAFANGRFEGQVPTGDGLVFKVVAPADASIFRFQATNSPQIEFRVEQGTWPTVTGNAHWVSGDQANHLMSVNLDSAYWPWQPDRTYYLRLVNHGAAAEPVVVQMQGVTPATADEDQDGLLDAWEKQFFPTTWQWIGPADDPDTDGRTVLLEAVLGGNPNGSEAAPLTTPVVTGSPKVLGIAFSLTEPLPANATLVVEGSGSLQAGAWETLATRALNGTWSGSATVEQAPPAGGKIAVTVRDTAHPGVAKRFLRLRIILN
jgi:hypothetical protein